MAAGVATSPSQVDRAKREGPRLPFSITTTVLLVVAAGLLIYSLVDVTFGQTVVYGLVEGTAFASLAVALVLIYRATGVFNFAQGEMAMATTYFLYQLNGVWHVTYWLAFALTMAFAFVFGVVVYIVFIRPVENRSPVATIIITIALFVLIDGVVSVIFGGEPKTLEYPFSAAVIGGPSGGLGVGLTWQDVLSFATTIGVMLFIAGLFRFTKLGLGMRAAAFRPGPARLVGVRVSRMLAIGWGLAAVLGAISGIMFEATEYFTLDPLLMSQVLLYSFVAATIGGLESPVGAVVCSLIFGIILALVAQYVTFVGTALQTPFALVVLLVILLIKPNGLFGKAAVTRV
jgi:branched-chain amino acid transport system permease protein